MTANDLKGDRTQAKCDVDADDDDDEFNHLKQKSKNKKWIHLVYVSFCLFASTNVQVAGSITHRHTLGRLVGFVLFDVVTLSHAK